MLADEFLGLDDDAFTAEEHPMTGEEVLSVLVSKAFDG